MASLAALVRGPEPKLGRYLVRTLARRAAFGPREREHDALLVTRRGMADAERRAHALDDLDALADAHGDASVATLDLPRPIGPLLAPRPSASAAQLGFADVRCAAADFAPHAPPDGSTVVVGIVDYGCDVRHPALRDAAGRTRVLALWDQNAAHAGEPVPASAFGPETFAYGAEHDAAAIQGWIDGTAAQPYDPGPVTADAPYHGTYVASIAAGSPAAAIGLLAADGGVVPCGLAHRGVAPAAPVVFVELGLTTADWSERLDGSRRFAQYSDCQKLADAVAYVYARAVALKRAGRTVDGVVVNLSVGTWGGAHDGRSLAERAIDDLVAAVDARPDLPPLAVVIGAGNAGGLKNHHVATLAPGETHTISWRMLAGDTTPNELEIWYRGAPAAITIAPPGIAPDDPTAFRLAEGGDVVDLTAANAAAGYAAHLPATDGRPHHLDVVVDPRAGPDDPALKGSILRATWTIRITAAAEDGPTALHLWLERDDADDVLVANPLGPTRRLLPDGGDPDGLSTLSSLSCGAHGIVVGGYAQARVLPKKSFAWAGGSRGPSPWKAAGDELAPDVCAPASAVLGAACGGSAYFAASGTSAATAHVSGAVALYYQAAAAAGRRPTSQELRADLRASATARRAQIMTNWSAAGDWDPGLGFGPLDVAGLVARARP